MKASREVETALPESETASLLEVGGDAGPAAGGADAELQPLHPPPAPGHQDATVPQPHAHAYMDDNIQGLRALCVLVVVLYHAYGEHGVFTGGWVGVDVFFVISGYVVTGMLLRELAASDTLDLVKFYLRRCWRLIPASHLVVLASLGGSAQLLPNGDLVRKWSVNAQWCTLFGANVYLYEVKTDYFKVENVQSPYMHFWSLAIEEQFYFIFPVLVLATHKLSHGSPRVLCAALGLLACGSLALSLTSSVAHPMYAFFHLAPRVYELLLGALVCLAKRQHHWTVPQRWRPATYLLSTLTMVASAALYTDQTFISSHGVATLVPLAAASLLLLSLADCDTARCSHDTPWMFLSHPAPVYIGDRSYSAYLWHWPVLVFVNVLLSSKDNAVMETTPALALFGRFIAVLAGMCLAMLSYTYVEAPFRTFGRTLSAPRQFCGVVALLATTLLLCMYVGQVVVPQQLTPHGPLVGNQTTTATAASLADMSTDQLTLSWIPGSSRQCQDLYLCTASGLTYNTYQPRPFRVAYDRSSTCALLQARGIQRISVVGDSIMRHVYFAWVDTLSGDFRGSPAHQPSAQSACSGAHKYIETEMCRVSYFPSFTACSGRVTVTFHSAAIIDPPTCSAGELVLWGLGAHPVDGDYTRPADQAMPPAPMLRFIGKSKICKLRQARPCALHWIPPHSFPIGSNANRLRQVDFFQQLRQFWEQSASVCGGATFDDVFTPVYTAIHRNESLRAALFTDDQHVSQAMNLLKIQIILHKIAL